MVTGSGEISSKLQKIIRRSLPRSMARVELHDHTNLRRDLHLDSMALMTVALQLEEAFGIDVASQAERMQKLQTFLDVVVFVQEAQGAGAQPHA